MPPIFQFGKDHPDYSVRVLNEREVRGAMLYFLSPYHRIFILICKPTELLIQLGKLHPQPT